MMTNYRSSKLISGLAEPLKEYDNVSWIIGIKDTSRVVGIEYKNELDQRLDLRPTEKIAKLLEYPTPKKMGEWLK